MKQSENNEIDLLLRSLARREGGRLVESADHSTEHLDVDEMNSYAEQVLPATTRARYTSHLADCESCRKMVTELTAASGLSHSEESSPQKSPAGMRQKLAAFFSPRLFRYAVPVVAIMAFIAVGLVALRQPKQAEFMAQNRTSSVPEGAIKTESAGSAEESQNSDLVAEQTLSDSKTPVAANGDKQAKSSEKNETSDAPTTTDSLKADEGRDVSPGKSAGAVAQPSYAPEPAAPPPPKAEVSEVESRSEVVARQKKEVDKNKDEQDREQGGSRARANDGRSDVASSPVRRPEQPAVQSEEKARPAETAKRASGVGNLAKENDADTRTLYGRRFRHQGGIWIDTAFQSGAVTVITRGSEQFRSLVADEPEIRAIASQLSGEVILVWKGRAYRIR